MTEPVWMALPPEVHSALLSSGPGPASLLAAAGSWSELSTEYASAAEQLSALLAEVQAGAWEGPSAESYVAAHVPYLAWLVKSSADSAAAATQHEVAAAAYTTALAAMPTLPELAGNHAVHGALVATNFFGINTIPIAVNESDYARMWVQAATTMSTYQAVSTAAVAATPPADPAPQIVKADAPAADPASAPNFSGDNPLGLPQWLQDFLKQFGINNSLTAHSPRIDNALDEAIANFLRNFGINWNPAQGTVNGATYDSYTDPSMGMYWVARALELFEDFQQFFTYLQQNPILAFQYLISTELYDWPLHIEQILYFVATQPELLVPAVILSAAPLAPLGAFAGLAGLAAIPAPAFVPVPAPAPVPPPVALPAPIASPVAAAAAAAPASAPAPGPAPTASTVAGPPPLSTPPAPAAPGFGPPYLVGPPMGLSSRMSTSASSSAKKKAPEPDAAAAATGAAAQEAARRRRRQRMRQRGHGDEFMDMNVEVDPEWGGPAGNRESAASASGAGNLGFAGTARAQAAGATGLTTLTGDEFGGGPTMPMMPATWAADSGGEQNEATRESERPDGRHPE